MRKILPVVMLGAATLMAASALIQIAAAQTTTTKPPAKPPAAAKPVAATARPAARPAPQARRPVFVPAAPVIELDEAPVVADLPTVLDTESRDRYRRIFQAQAAGQWSQADAEIAKQTDKTLMGYVGAQRLLSQGYPARYEELATWLQDYNDHPDAPAIYKLALARRTPGGPALTPASFVGFTPGSPSFAAARTVTGGDASQAADLRARLQHMIDDSGYNAAFVLLDRKSTADTLGPQEVELWRGRIRTRALEADSQRGVQVPVEVGLPPDANWTAAVSAFTRGNMAEAARRFELVADAPPDRASSWTLSAGSFWAGRANLLAGNPQKFAPYLKRAALHGRTFYGLVAQKALGMQIAPDWKVPELDRRKSDLLRNDRTGKRALALLQLGATTAAERELYAGSIDADPQYVEAVLGLANKAALPGLSVRVGNANWDQRHNIKGYDGAMYPIPPWQPAGGFTVDRALVYGFMRQESAFNPKARSYVGAMGLMQLMPSTARLVATRYIPDHGAGNPYEPSTNVALGQAYISQLLNDVDNNLVRTTAGYNGGPGNVMKWDGSLNASQDPLLYIASIPLHETRDFVQRVLANYWLYQVRLGQPTPSLDQIAAHEWPRYTAQDTRR
ncbi:MAG: lytic transglycosylase domain-containing protein [Reyranella sp.]|uniref:lytic transglycosylase domain-containing protein n=1 Tax=Reyranella sp. TaxID=1929291 RepID=UPI00122AB9FA|nr:lytic transglycosylase domain-containing protein [Reyranella sp.]TAJ41506.1 MAG: lytic transglycosylase domain-containing protein [Reyranella sp.]